MSIGKNNLPPNGVTLSWNITRVWNFLDTGMHITGTYLLFNLHKYQIYDEDMFCLRLYIEENLVKVWYVGNVNFFSDYIFLDVLHVTKPQEKFRYLPVGTKIT